TCIPPAQGADLRALVDGYRTAHERQILQQLGRLVQVRSVAADPAGLVAAANMLVDALRQRGFQAQAQRVAGAPPLVLGEWPIAGASRTVVFYAHYDG